MADKSGKNIPESRNTGVLAKLPKPHGKPSWKNFFGAFLKSTDGSVDSGTSSKSTDRSVNKRSTKKDKEKVTTEDGFNNQPSSSKSPEDPLALKVTLPSNISNSDLSVSLEVESVEGKKKMKKKNKSKMYLTCIRKTEKLSEYEGQLVLPPDTNIDKLAKMPLYFVDTDGNPLKSNDDDYTVFQPVKNTLSKNVDIGMKIKDVHLKVRLEKLNFNRKPQKIPKYLSCSFVTASQCPPPNANLQFDDEFDFDYEDDEADEGELSGELKKKEVVMKQDSGSTESSEKIVGDILRSVMCSLPVKEQCTQYNYTLPEFVPHKESAESVLPRSSSTTLNTIGYSEISSYYIDSVPQNSPTEKIAQLIRCESFCQGDEYYGHNKQLVENERELQEHQRRVEELDKTLELLQNARSKLTSFLVPPDGTNLNMVDPAKVYHLLPLAGVPPVSYLCAAQSPGNSSLSIETENQMEMVITTTDGSKSTDAVQPDSQCTSSNMDTHGDIPLVDDLSVVIVKAQTKLEEELQKFREKDKSKSDIEFVSQHKHLRSITVATPKLKLNTIQNLYYSPKFAVEFDAVSYEGLNALYEKRYGNKNKQSIASRENDIAYHIVENDIKSMIHDLLKETWNIKETVLENYGNEKVNQNDDLISLIENEIMDNRSSSNCTFFSELQNDHNSSTNQEIEASTEETKNEFPPNISTVAIPYQVNYCIINNPQKSAMVTVNKLNTYQVDDQLKGTLKMSSGLKTNIFNEMYAFDTNLGKEIQFNADDNVSDKKDAAANETFESQYSKGYNVMVAEMPMDKTNTKFILNTAQIQDLREDEDSVNDDECDDDAPQPSEPLTTNSGALKSTKFADINTTKNLSETDTDFAETEINTVYSTSPVIIAISSFNSESTWAPLRINHPVPVLQSFCDNNDDETVIRETDLTKKYVSLPILEHMEDKISQVIVTAKKSITMSQKSKHSYRSRSSFRACISPSSTSDESALTKSTQTIITLKEQTPIISDSDSEGIRIVQPNPVEDSVSHIALKLKKPLEEIVPTAGTSRGGSEIDIDSYVSSISHRTILSVDYEADTDNVTISLPNLRYKHTSVEELNTQEDIDKIELNVWQNDKLNEENYPKHIIRTDVSFELNMDDSSSYLSTQSSLLLTEEEHEPIFKKSNSKVSPR